MIHRRRMPYPLGHKAFTVRGLDPHMGMRILQLQAFRSCSSPGLFSAGVLPNASICSIWRCNPERRLKKLLYCLHKLHQTASSLNSLLPINHSPGITRKLGARCLLSSLPGQRCPSTHRGRVRRGAVPPCTATAAATASLPWRPVLPCPSMPSCLPRKGTPDTHAGPSLHCLPFVACCHAGLQHRACITVKASALRHSAPHPHSV